MELFSLGETQVFGGKLIGRNPYSIATAKPYFQTSKIWQRFIPIFLDISNSKKKSSAEIHFCLPKKKSNNANAQGRLALRHQNRSSTSRTRSWKSLSLAPGRGQRGSDLSWSRCRFFGTKMDGLAVKVRLDIYCRFRKLVKNGLFVMVPFIRRQFWWMLLDVVGCYARLFRG